MAPVPIPEPPAREELPETDSVNPRVPIVADPSRGPLETATWTQLESYGLNDQPGSVAAILLARRIDRASLLDSGSAYAALVKEFRAAFAEATVSAQKPVPQRIEPSDPVDEIAQRRAEKVSGA
jgi:hypothetical protein